MIRNKHSKLAIKLTPVLLGALFFAILCLPLQVRADGGGYDATTGTWGNYDFSYNSASHTLTLTGTGNINLPYDFSWYYWLDEIETIVLPDGFTGWNSGYRDSFFALPGVKEYQVSSGNTTYKVIDGVLYSKDGTTLIDYPNGTAGSSFTMPSSVTKLGEASFYKVNTIGAITLPSSVFKVGPNCFEASSLSKLTVNNRNIWFQSGAFRDCTSFTQIAIGPGKSSSDFFVYDNVLYHKDTIRVDGNEETQKAILLYPTAKPGTTFTIPSGVDYVDCAFRDALYIKTLKVPVTVKSVDQYAFTSNYIENFYIPSTVKFLDDVNLAMYAQTDSGKDVTIYGASGSDIAKFASSEGI